MTLSSNLTAYTPIPENSQATPGLFHQRLDVLDANIRTINSLAGAGAVLYNVKSQGSAAGDGSTDDSARFTAAVTAATKAGLEIPSSNYSLAGSVSLTTIKAHSGAVLGPNSGFTLSLTGPIDAGPYKIFDLTKGGLDFSNNRSLHFFDAKWFGIVGDGTTDDQPSLTSMVAYLPDYSTVYFPPNLVMKLGSTWTISARRGLRFRCHGSPFPDGSNAAQFKWQGGAGGTMVALVSCDSPEIEGFFFNMGPSSSQYATTGIDLDTTGTNGVTGTQATIEGNLFNALQSSSTSYSCIRIGRTATGNQEYHRIARNHFFGTGFMLNANNGVTVTASGSTATVNGTTSLTTGTSYRMRIAGGAGSTLLDTTGVAISTSALTLASQSSAVTNATVIVGQQYGNGINIICSQSKGIYIHDNYLIGFARGIWLQNGSFLGFKNNFNNNEADMQLDNATESCEDHFSNTEQSRQHAVFTTNYSMPTRFQSCRWSGLCANPNTGWIEVGGSAMPIEVVDCEFDSAPASGTSSSAYSFLANFNGSFRAAFNRYAGTWTPQQVGYLGVDAQSNDVYPRGGQYRIESLGETLISNWPVQWVSGDSASHRGIDKTGVGFFEVRTNGTNIPKHVGLIGAARRMHNGNSGDVLVGVQGLISKDSGGGGLVNFTNEQHSVEAVLFNGNTEGFTVTAMHGFHVAAPVMAGGGSGATIRGLYIENLTGGGGATTPTNTWGIVQVGSSDTNRFAGPVDLATNGARFSMRTLAASAITASAANTNVATNEVVFTIGGASGASLAIMSGGTLYYFNSSGSAKAT